MLQQTLASALEGVSGLESKAYPVSVRHERDATPPYAIYSVVAAVPENTLADGQSGRVTRVQVDYYAGTYGVVQTLARAGWAAILAAFPGALCLLEQDFHDDTTELYRVLHDYSIFSTQP